MASVEARDIPELNSFIHDYWNLIKSFYIPEDNDNYWFNFEKAILILLEKYGIKKRSDNPFVSELLDAFWKDSERRYRDARKST